MSEADYLAPRSEVERTIAAIWQEALHLERVGVYDDFFDLGGHSLLATRVVSRVRETFGVELSLGSFFEAPTVAGLAMTITQRQAQEADPQEMTRILAELEEM